jgi:hypothetical protein
LLMSSSVVPGLPTEYSDGTTEIKIQSDASEISAAVRFTAP